MAMEILGVKIDRIDLPQALARIGELLQGGGQALVATVNPEFIMAAQKNEAFRHALNNSALSVADGFGLILAARILTGEKIPRVTGVDLSLELLSGRTEAKIYLLGGRSGAAEAVKDKYQSATIVGAESGGELSIENWQLSDNEAVISRINASGANLVLVAFGQVKQEMWIVNNLNKMPGVKIAIGVGGTFDYLSGRIKRAPAFVRSMGLEWLYRLFSEPQRWQRIANATIGFGWLAAKEKINTKR